jgi:redox-sensitive bicupin YhaK (pirin superfamily)
VKEGYTVFAYVVEGGFDERAGAVQNLQVVLYGDGDGVAVRAAHERPLRFLFLSGRPLREPIAWSGPIVMNTDEEVREAFREYRAGTFVKRWGR